MNRRLRAALKDWTPPVAMRALRRFGGDRFGGMKLEGEFASWEDAVAASVGYDHPSILERVADATRVVRRGEAAYERDSILFRETEYSWAVLSAMLWGAAMSGGRLSVLDFGGALGSAYFQHRGALADLSEIQWGVVEQPHYVAEGRREFQDDKLRFFSTIEECAQQVQPNVILLGSVLQYLPRPNEILGSLTRTAASVMIVDRTPFSDIDSDRIMIQRVPRSIYPASYPFRILSRARMMEMLLRSWQFVAPIEAPEGKVDVTRSLSLNFEGFILHR